MQIVEREISELIPADYNPRQLSDSQYQDIRNSLEKFGFVDPVVINTHDERAGIIIGGHQRIKVWQTMGNSTVPTVEVNLPFEDERELNVRLNKNSGAWDMDLLANYFDEEDLIDWGFEAWELGLGGDDPGIAEDEPHGKLTDKFIIPPFSVLDTRQGQWKERKAYWHKQIGDNGESRENTLAAGETNIVAGINNGVSLLDPVMAELVVRWFGLPGGHAFDPFAGDTVFGYVSATLGQTFTGIELREEQTALNNARVKEAGLSAHYINDDGQKVAKHIKSASQDLLFSCPPYFDLEVYSDKPNDASNQADYSDFMDILRNAFVDGIKCLKNGRFAVVVVGDIRDKRGYYRRFVDGIKDIFDDGGMQLYNEMILVEALGTLPQRVGRYMKNRKIGKCHQNILVFYKGDPAKISSNYPELEIVLDESEDLEP